jgi:hypothetical protein
MLGISDQQDNDFDGWSRMGYRHRTESRFVVDAIRESGSKLQQIALDAIAGGLSRIGCAIPNGCGPDDQS